MADTRTPNEHYEAIGEDLIETEPELHFIQDLGVRIAYLESDEQKKSGNRKVMGQCEKVATKNQWGIPFDFTVTLFTPNIQQLSERQLRILIHHELLHIGLPNGHLGVVPHDVDEFKIIIEKYGLDWDKEDKDG